MKTLKLTLAALLLALLAGCVDAATRALIADANNKTAAQLADVKNQAKIAAEKAKEATDRAEAAAKAKPTSHPIEWANIIIAEVRGPLILVGSIATLAFFVGIGMWVASLFAVALKAILSSVALLVAPIAGCVSAGCWLTLAFLPWAPWIIGGCAALALTTFLIQLAHAKWSIGNLFGLHAANSKAIEEVAQGKPPTKMDVPVPAPKATITSVHSPLVVGAAGPTV